MLPRRLRVLLSALTSGFGTGRENALGGIRSGFVTTGTTVGLSETVGTPPRARGRQVTTFHAGIDTSVGFFVRQQSLFDEVSNPSRHVSKQAFETHKGSEGTVFAGSQSGGYCR